MVVYVSCTMYNGCVCVMYNVQCTMVVYVSCTMYNGCVCVMYNVQCIMYNVGASGSVIWRLEGS